MTQYTLTGQTAVVTGGGRGIGREIARALAQAGAKVAVTARTRTQLDETVQLVENNGGQCMSVVMDVTDAEQVRTGMAEIAGHFGPIDLLVNNAGLGGNCMLPWEVDADAWWRTIEVNLRGVFLCCQAVMPVMVERQQGRIINVGSNIGNRPSPMSSAYAVSKAALMRLTDSFAEALKEHNVSVFAISPGLVLTDMTRDIPAFKELPPSAWVPIERAGELCVVLASGKADRLTGRFIHAQTDDIHSLIERADKIVEQDLHTLRLLT